MRRLITVLSRYVGYLVFTILTTLAFSEASWATNFGYLRALQQGPVGDALAYANLGKYEPEGVIAIGSASGTEDINASSDDKLKSSAMKLRAAAGGGIVLSREFVASAYMDVNVNDYDDETRSDPATKLSSGYNTYEFSANIVFKPNPLIIGGGIGAILIGSEKREFEWDVASFKHNVSSAAMPMLRLYGGFGDKEFQVTGGFRLFTQGEAEVETKDSSGANAIVYDIARRYPGEVHADAKISAISDVDLGFGVAYVLTGQASPEVDEFSVQYADVNGKRVRITGGDKRNVNHLRLGAGARISANNMVDLLAGLQYIQPSYKKEEYASLEHENMGGFRIDLGTDITVMKRIRGFFQAGYLVSSGVSYTASDNSRGAAAGVDRLQHAPINEGDEVKMTQTMWTLQAGGGYRF